MARADELRECLVSPNEGDSNGEPANVVDALFFAGRAVANAITPRGNPPGMDASGCSVGSLTEAVMGITAGLFEVAAAIDRLADSVEAGRASGTRNQ